MQTSKKQYLYTLLEELKTQWSPAEGLLVLLENNSLNDDFVDLFIKEIDKSIKTIQNKEVKNQLKKTKTYLQNLKEKEAEERKKEEEEADSLLDKI